MAVLKLVWKQSGYLVQFGLILISLMILSKAFRNNNGEDSVDSLIDLNNLADKIRELAPINAESRSRVSRVKSLQHGGGHTLYLSYALLDMFSFSSRCEVDPEGRFRSRASHSTTIVLLQSSATNFKKRRLVRETWAKLEWCRKHGVVLRFIMGVPSSAETVSKLSDEYQRYGDTLVGNFSDTSTATSLKALLGLRWAHTFCTKARYIVHATDDTIIRFDKLKSVLRIFKREGNSEVIIGKLASDTDRDFKNKENPYYIEAGILNLKPSQDKFPPFCLLSSGVVMPIKVSIDFFKFAWEATDPVPYVDAFLGIAAESWGLKILDSTLFSDSRIKEACAMSERFTSLLPEDMLELRNFVGMIFDRWYMKDCNTPDLDLIYAGKDVDNTMYFDEVLKLAKAPPAADCKDDHGMDAALVVLISSKADNRDLRDVIRRTWASRSFTGELQISVKVLFLIGQPEPKDRTLRETLDKEHAMLRRDLLEGTFVDSFKNLTLKYLFGLTWVSEHCKHTPYILKTEDDSFVNLKNIVTMLLDMEDQDGQGESLKGLYVGQGGAERRVLDHKDKYHVSSEEYDAKVFPQYLVGGGVVMSTDLLAPLLEEAKRTPLIHPVDDVYVGILLHRLDVKVVYNKGFHYDEESTDPCYLRESKFMALHLHSRTKDLVEIWNNFIDPAVECK